MTILRHSPRLSSVALAAAESPREFEQSGLVEALERLVESGTRGDPMSPLRWTCKSTRTLAGELTRQGFMVSCNTVGRLLRSRGYSLQANRKTLEGKQHPDRDAQFRHISRRVSAFQRAGQPVISVDTNKKEPLGKMKNPGRAYRRKGDPEKVTTHDFPDKKRGKAVPYGAYDLTHDIEHRLFCHITRNWQGIPLETMEIIVNLIGSTRTKQGLEVHAWLDKAQYEKSRKVSDAQLSEVRIRRDNFHGEWNYHILPNNK